MVPCWRERRVSSTIHRTYVFDNFINYERSDDNGDTWDYQDAPDFGANPSLALCGGSPWISYLRADSTGHNETLYTAVLNADSGWKCVAVYAPFRPTPWPAVTWRVSEIRVAQRLGNVVFPCYDTVATHSLISMPSSIPAATVILDTLDDLSGQYTDSSACVVVGVTDTIATCYGSGDSIYERKRHLPTRQHLGQPDRGVRPV